MKLTSEQRRRITIFAALLAAFTVSCGGSSLSPRPSQPTTPRQHCSPNDYSMPCALTTPPPSMLLQLSPSVARGIDFGWGGFSASWMHSHGYTFGASYLSYDPSKNWSQSLVRSYAAAGIARVFVWETTANRALTGCAGGASDARTALAQGARLGFRALYFAVDFELQPGEASTVANYFRCVDGVIGVQLTGAYGGYATVSLLFNLHLVRYGWQTYAWSGGRWDRRAQLEQYLNGNAFDYDRAIAKDYGQTPAPGPKPKPEPNHRAQLLHRRAVLRGLLTKYRCRTGYAKPARYWTACGIWKREGDQDNRELRGR